MDKTSYFKPFIYTNRLVQYSVNSYYVDYIDRNGNLRQTLLKARNANSASTMAELFEDPKFGLMGATQEQQEENVKKFVEGIDKKNQEAVHEFFIILFNQTLVMLITVFDTFLVDCYEVIVNSKPELFNSEVPKEKILERFDKSGIEEKFKKFEKIGLTTSVLFELNEKILSSFPDPNSMLLKAYHDRHDIVHRNQMVIKSYKEISVISDLMLRLIVYWGTVTFTRTFHITSDNLEIHKGNPVPLE